jgi:very-short-patch-repair endonuclease/predicted nucleic acid-binding Zn ribbon protein
MKGNCDLVKCQICQQEMSFGRIKRHIKVQHKDINVDQYVKMYWSTLPLHHPCEVCNKNIVYKYQTCSKECQSIKASNERKGKSKPEGFMNDEHKLKLRKAMIGKPGGFTGHKHSEKTKQIQSENVKRTKPHLGHKHSEKTKQIQSQKRKEYYTKGNEPWTKTNPHTPETIEKIFKKRKMNKLEAFVSNILDKNDIKYTYQFFLSKDSICKSYDFKIKDTNILLEVDGDYWHGGPSLDKHFYKLDEIKKNDEFKKVFAESNGFKLIRIWESEIYENPNIILENINIYK